MYRTFLFAEGQHVDVEYKGSAYKSLSGVANAIWEDLVGQRKSRLSGWTSLHIEQADGTFVLADALDTEDVHTVA
jgi:hypothetical protein